MYSNTIEVIFFFKYYYDWSMFFSQQSDKATSDTGWINRNQTVLTIFRLIWNLTEFRLGPAQLYFNRIFGIPLFTIVTGLFAHGQFTQISPPKVRLG